MSSFELIPATHLGIVNESAYLALSDFLGVHRQLFSEHYKLENGDLVAIDPAKTSFEMIPGTVFSPFIDATDGWLLDDEVRVSYSSVSVPAGELTKPQPWHFDDFGTLVRAVVFSSTVPTQVANGVMDDSVCYGGFSTVCSYPLFDDETIERVIHDPAVTGIWLQDEPAAGQGVGLTEKTLHKPGVNNSKDKITKTSIRLLTSTPWQ